MALTIQERLAAKAAEAAKAAAPKIESGVASSVSIIPAGLEAIGQDTKPSSDTPITPAEVKSELDTADLAEGTFFAHEGQSRFLMPGGVYLYPDAKRLVVAKNDKQFVRMQYFAEMGRCTLIK